MASEISSQAIPDAPVYKVYCSGCGLEMLSQETPDDLLASIRQADPAINWVDFYCKLCLGLISLASPQIKVYGGPYGHQGTEIYKVEQH